MKKIEIKNSKDVQVAGRDIHYHAPPPRRFINVRIPSKEEILNFLRIYPDVWKALFSPNAFINRITGGYPKINSLVAFFFSMIIAVSVIMFFISQVDISPSFSKEITWLRGKALALIMPFPLITSLLPISLSSFVFHQIYKRFGGKCNYRETLSFNLYFFSAWIVFVIVGARYTEHSLRTAANDSPDPLSLLLLVVMLYALISYVATLNKLMNVSHVKGVLAYSLVLIIHLVFIWPLLRIL